MKKLFRTWGEVPTDIQKLVESYWLTTHEWSGILFFDCGWRDCKAQNEDYLHMIRHAQDHGIFPAPEEPPPPPQPQESTDQQQPSSETTILGEMSSDITTEKGQ